MSSNPHQDALQKQFGSARPGADFGRLGGGFGQADSNSIKHTFGRIAQNFDTSDAGLQAMVQDEEFRRAFPNAKLNKDWIDFGGQVDPHTGTNVGKIDVQRGWVQGGRGGPWQWLTEEEALGNAGQPTAQRQGNPIGSVMPGQSSDLMEQILASLQGPQPDPQALLLQQLL